MPDIELMFSSPVYLIYKVIQYIIILYITLACWATRNEKVYF